MSAIYVNASLHEAERARLERALAGREVLWGAPTKSVLHAGPADDELKRAAIVFGQPDPQQLLDAPNLRWVQLTSAGWARYDRDDVKAAMEKRGTILCNASSVYADPVAEHAIAMMLALLRRLPEALDEQRGAHGWPQAALRAGSRRVAGQHVLLLGYGAIARAMVERLLPFGCHLVGYRREVRGDEEIPVVTAGGLIVALGKADHVFNLLPDSPSTVKFFDAAKLAACKRGARLYNLGRGSTVDQDALQRALASGHLDAAWLDVTSPEPLPVDDPLWTTPRSFLSPHTAGGHADEEARHVDLFLANLAAFAIGQPLRDRVL